MIKQRFLIILFALVTGKMAYGQSPSAKYEKSMVVIKVAKQEWNIDAPWTREQVKQREYLATLIKPNLFLTTADAVAGANFIEFQRYGSPRKYSAEVVFKDYEANLAAIKATNEGDIKGMQPLGLGPSELPLNTSVTLLNGKGDRLFARRAELRNVATRSSSTSPYPFPSYELELNDGASFGYAEPVLQKGKVVGITTERRENVLYALPGMVIRHFLNDDLSGEKYRGFPFVGTATHPLLSPDFRKYLGVESDRGVRVSEVFPNSPFHGDLEVGDVLIEVDGMPIDARGNYSHRYWGKIFFSYLIAQKYSGDQLTMTIIRKGETLKITKTLKRFDRNRSRVAYYRPDIKRIPHVVVGGLVIQELSRPYLMTWGKEWNVRSPDRLLYFWYYRNNPPEKAGKRTIILNRVLSDPYNQGHQGLSDYVIEKINDRSVESIPEVRAALNNPIEKNGSKFIKIEFFYGAPAVFLSYDGLEKAHARIAKSYSIKSKDSFFELKN